MQQNIFYRKKKRANLTFNSPNPHKRRVGNSILHYLTPIVYRTGKELEFQRWKLQQHVVSKTKVLYINPEIEALHIRINVNITKGNVKYRQRSLPKLVGSNHRKIHVV